MDWARAKNILLILLLALNVVLAASILNRMLGGGADRELYTGVTRILDGRGVQMRCDFPRQIKNSELLIYGDGVRFVDNCARALNIGGATASGSVEMLGRESLRYTNESPDVFLAASTPPAADTEARRFLAGAGIDIDGFKTDYITAYTDGGYHIQYIYDYKGNLVFDSRVEVTLEGDGGVSEITISYREIKSASLDRVMDVIPAYQVILKNYIDGGVVIESISIGFMGQNTARENPFIESEEGAVWRVRLDDGSVRYFEATYGDEIFLYAPV